MLNLIENPLRENGWSFARLDGSMTLQQRRQQLEAFKTQSKVRLLLMSLKAGGLGLNLTEANYVFMLDPWWNRKDLILFSFLIFSLSLSLILF
jgi:DNA repair protein RAD5